MSNGTTPFRFPDEPSAILALTLVADVGSVTHQQLIERFGSASRALDGGFAPNVAADARARAGEMIRRGTERGLSLTIGGDDTYPSQLSQLHAPPPVLWWRGDRATLSDPIVAIVGTRRATSYGERVTREMAGAFARAGVCVVSGMALGIDAYAHRATLDANGRTIAVLGTGADVAYPRAHTALHREIGARGLLLSEFPPGAKSGPGSFPRRNRIIAGLASLTIVIEAPERSGALITARDALELGRDVAAVPGPIDSPQSVGSNNLLREGAHVLTSVADALRLVGVDAPAKRTPELRTDDESRVWAALDSGAMSLDQLCSRTALPISQCLAAVTELELRGVVECALTGETRRR